MKHIKPLHGLRGAAAVTVVTGHYGAVHGEPGLGVVLFFVLSGFLMGTLYLEKPFSSTNVFEYLVARFARVYPLFAFVVLAVGLLNYLEPPALIFLLTPDRIIPHLLLFGSGMTIWTICTEFHFYFAFVALWWARQKVRNPQAIIVAGIIVFGLWALYLNSAAGRTNIFSYLHVFLIGALIATSSKHARARWRGVAGYAMPGLIAAYAAVYLLARHLHSDRSIFVDPSALAVCAGLVFCAVAAGESWVNQALSIPVAQWLGEISFGIYLFHRPATWIVDRSYGADPAWISRGLQVLLTIMAAQTAYWLLEKPCRVRIRGLGQAFVNRQRLRREPAGS